jgi:formylglycine-generating enzyme required for sulfatase activity
MKPKLKPSLYLAFLGLLAAGATLAVSACAGGSPTPEAAAPSPTPLPPTAPVSSTTPTPSTIPRPTATPVPSDTPTPNTPRPTHTSTPTNSPQPTDTPTLTPQPTKTPAPTSTASLPPPFPPLLPGAADAPMVEVPAGQFVMGIDPAAANRLYLEWWTYDIKATVSPNYSTAVPRLTVSLPAFAIDRLQVTNADYRRCVAAGVCSPPAGEQVGVPQDYFDAATYADYPANVLWQQAATYCQWQGKRLPTEAEWEKAARGTDERRYPWGETWDESRVAMQVEPVGRHPTGASPYGVLDMIGDLPEWTQDTYQLYPGNIAQPEAWYAKAKVVRGGMLDMNAAMHGTDADTSLRLGYNPSVAPTGFRCVKGGAPAPLVEVLVSYEPMVITVTPRSQVDLTGMVAVPAGEFIMGTPDDWVDKYKQDHQAEKPQHRVYLDAFYIDKYEVTYQDYAAFLSDLGRSTAACEGGYTCAEVRTEAADWKETPLMEQPGKPKNSYRVLPGYERYPAAYISWYGAKTYCTWLGKRLPTEAEWEKAARGTDGRRYPWGNEWDSRALADGKTSTVREVGLDPLNVSPYGAMDMLGNIGEWVSDWYDPNYYAVSPYRNPPGPAEPPSSKKAWRSIRSPAGGAVEWGLSARAADSPDTRSIWGFRCAFSAKQ